MCNLNADGNPEKRCSSCKNMQVVGKCPHPYISYCSDWNDDEDSCTKWKYDGESNEDDDDGLFY